jgi:DNA-directed RNA polymerase subunit RPC12/RpoP
MNKIAFSCPGCGKSLEVPASVAGQEARCKRCGELTRVLLPTGSPSLPERCPSPSKTPLLRSLAVQAASGRDWALWPRARLIAF